MSAERAAAYWGSFLGVDPAVFAEAGTHFVPHAGLASWNGLWAFRRGSTRVISCPAERLEEVAGRLAEVADEDLDDRAVLGERLARPADAIIGPAWWGRLDVESFRPAADARVRELADSDCGALERMRAACGEDFETSGIDPERMPLQGAFEDGELVALGGWRSLGPAAGDPCLVTHPSRRGGGLAKGVASELIAVASARGQLVLYQTLAANAPAVAVARALGLVQDAGHVAVRLG